MIKIILQTIQNMAIIYTGIYFTLNKINFLKYKLTF